MHFSKRDTQKYAGTYNHQASQHRFHFDKDLGNNRQYLYHKFSLWSLMDKRIQNRSPGKRNKNQECAILIKNHAKISLFLVNQFQAHAPFLKSGYYFQGL